MPTEKEIKDSRRSQHDALSASYYGGTSGLTKEQFDQQHGQVWADMEADLITNGYRQPAMPEPDWKALYRAASTDSERLGVMSRRLGLED